MTTLHELRKYCTDVIAQYPELNEEVSDLLDLAISEIEEGSSVRHEIELCKNDIESLIKYRQLD